MLKLLDIFFMLFHSMVVIFNLFGWIFKKTRFANLLILSLTGVSWFILGIFYGIGYCPLTDWHFQVLERLGYTNLPTSYIQYMVDRLTGLHPNAHVTDIFTMSFFIASFVMSITLNVRDFKKMKSRNRIK